MGKSLTEIMEESLASLQSKADEAIASIKRLGDVFSSVESKQDSLYMIGSNHPEGIAKMNLNGDIFDDHIKMDVGKDLELVGNGISIGHKIEDELEKKDNLEGPWKSADKEPSEYLKILDEGVRSSYDPNQMFKGVSPTEHSMATVGITVTNTDEVDLKISVDEKDMVRDDRVDAMGHAINARYHQTLEELYGHTLDSVRSSRPPIASFSEEELLEELRRRSVTGVPVVTATQQPRPFVVMGDAHMSRVPRSPLGQQAANMFPDYSAIQRPIMPNNYEVLSRQLDLLRESVMNSSLIPPSFIVSDSASAISAMQTPENKEVKIEIGKSRESKDGEPEYSVGIDFADWCKGQDKEVEPVDPMVEVKRSAKLVAKTALDIVADRIKKSPK